MYILESKQVSKHFGGLKAVDCVDMQVKKGEIFGIIGPNGAGKTTFFNLCAGTYPVTSGEIWFDGQNTTNKAPDQMAKLGLARTFQNIKLFDFMTVSENIAVGFHIHTKTNLLDALLHTKRFKQEEEMIRQETKMTLEELGLSQYADVKANNLSYGLRRKVEIARTLVMKPKILLLDEPAAGMNPSETVELLEFVKKLNKMGYTIVVIEHDMKFIMNLCDRILVLNYGKKICEGTPQDIKNSQTVAEAYFGKGLAASGGEINA